MIIIPAIDIKDGQCVRLTQGDYSQKTVYSQNPMDVALNWQAQGANLIHIVDLDGAKNGNPVNAELIKQIARKLKIPVEVGGGIRDEQTIHDYLSGGVESVVLGTVILGNQSFARAMFKQFNTRIIVGLDAKNDILMTNGWLEGSNLNVYETALVLQQSGAGKIIFTDISKDGSLSEPNYSSIEKLTSRVRIPVIASGGVASIDQILKLKKLGVEGVILGKSLYEGRINLKEAITSVG